MNWAHIHLMLTHIPVIGIGAVTTFLLVGMARDSRELEWVSLQMFVALALVTIAVYLTGSPASHQIRVMPEISRATIHRHSSAADFAFSAMEVLGAVSLAVLVKFWRLAAVPKRLMKAVLLLALVVVGLMIWTAGLGGRIRHPEIGTLQIAASNTS
ncbi:MAG: hypothetical protein ACRD4Y_05635 [Candidatus Acidiferrales bacterium]